MPGKVIQSMKKAKRVNPLFLLDEIDKMGSDFRGDPAAALLEVLDPAQNHSFRDHYLEVPFDLSKVLFIATANQLGPVHPALLDRMEIISLAGYTAEDKVHIARRYLLPRQLSENGLPATALELSDAALRRVIGEYTREAGVRSLERQLGTIARKVAARAAGVLSEPAEAAASVVTDAAAAKPGAASMPAADPAAMPIPIAPAITAVGGGSADQPSEKVQPVATTQAAANIPTTIVDGAHVPEYLGPPRFRQEVAFRTSRPGVATGLAWTESGGDVLFIEASLLPGGHGNLQLTGQLGNVMQESARAALSHIRASAASLGVNAELFKTHDLHVHVPAGAIPKDGPSAGVTMATAILSALRNEPVRKDVAMTGEITLSGLVLPVGGIREKSLAARRHGIKTVVLPADNQIDLDELPKEVREEMTFVPARSLDEVLRIALPANEAAVAVE
jgi:endopeptidase La